MADVHFGRTTLIKFVGGELFMREFGIDTVAMRARLEGVKKRALDLRPPFEAFQPIWIGQTQDVFSAEGLPASWPALSPAYAARKAATFPGQTILRRTDRLYASLTEIGNPEMIWETTPRTIHYGSRVPYWRIHQTGGSRMPARPPVVMLRTTFDQLRRLVMDYVVRGGGNG